MEQGVLSNQEHLQQELSRINEQITYANVLSQQSNRLAEKSCLLLQKAQADLSDLQVQFAGLLDWSYLEQLKDFDGDTGSGQ